VCQRARAGAFLTTLLLLTAIFGTYSATAGAEEDSWDSTGMSIGFGGIYRESGGVSLYYDWCGPRNTLRALNDEGLIPQYNVDQASWVPFVDSVTFTVAGDHGSLHTVFARYVDSEGDPAYAAGEHGLYLALDTTGPVTKAPSAVKVRRFAAAEFRFRVRDKGSCADTVRIVVKKMSGERVARYLVGQTEINHLVTYRKKIFLTKGRYRWFVMAIDKTGNAQVSAGRNTLVVEQPHAARRTTAPRPFPLDRAAESPASRIHPRERAAALRRRCEPQRIRTSRSAVQTRPLMCSQQALSVWECHRQVRGPRPPSPTTHSRTVVGRKCERMAPAGRTRPQVTARYP
jgi:hypothetical protein